MNRSQVTDVRFAAAGPQQVDKGRLGWVSLRYGDLILDGITLRRTRDGRHVLSYPVRHDAAKRQHPLVRPIDDAARREIERQVFGALDLVREVTL